METRSSKMNGSNKKVENRSSKMFLHGGTTPWSAVGVSASTHFQPRPIPEQEKDKSERVGGNFEGKKEKSLIFVRE